MQTLKGITGTLLSPYRSICRADPCWQHQTPPWASSLTVSPSQGMLIWDLFQPLFLLPQSVIKIPPSQGGSVQ